MLSFWLSDWCVCMCVLFIYTISISIVCVSREELTLTESNQKTHGFYKWVIFKMQRHCGKETFDTSELSIQCNIHSCCEHITVGVNIYLYGRVNLLAPECVVCLCVSAWSNQSASKKPYVPDLNKFDTLLHKTQSQVVLVLRYRASTCVGP